jgi:hypothetical protein
MHQEGSPDSVVGAETKLRAGRCGVRIALLARLFLKLIRSNKMQHAGIYLLQNHSTCFGCPSHPSLGVHKTLTAASGTGHSIWVTTLLQRKL